MVKIARVSVVLLLVFAGFLLFSSNQAGAACTAGGSYSQVVFDGIIRVTYDSCTGLVSLVEFCGDLNHNGICEEPGETWYTGDPEIIYICNGNPDDPPADLSCQLMTNFGPDSGCACYNRCVFYVKGKRYVCRDCPPGTCP